MRKSFLVSVACFICLSLTGCPLGVAPVRVTVEAFEKIGVGMTMQEVEEILGRPGLDMVRSAEPGKAPDVAAEAKWKRWQHERTSYPKYIAIAFVDEKVVAKELVGFR